MQDQAKDIFTEVVNSITKWLKDYPQGLSYQ